MTTVVISPQASGDEAGILNYLAQEAGARVASKYRERFRACYRLLLAYPLLGIPRPELGRGVRTHIVEPYLVFYRLLGEVVTVLRILHGRRKTSPSLLT